jgi:uncharacterized protein YjiS (DUF1127 family)
MREAASFISRQSSTAPAGALQAIMELLWSAYHAHIRRKQLIRLSEVDDHLLADVGVTREDVRWALDLPFSHDPGLELQRRALRNSRRGWRS